MLQKYVKMEVVELQQTGQTVAQEKDFFKEDGILLFFL